MVCAQRVEDLSNPAPVPAHPELCRRSNAKSRIFVNASTPAIDLLLIDPAGKPGTESNVYSSLPS
jgi:hypothetical protein